MPQNFVIIQNISYKVLTQHTVWRIRCIDNNEQRRTEVKQRSDGCRMEARQRLDGCWMKVGRTSRWNEKLLKWQDDRTNKNPTSIGWKLDENWTKIGWKLSGNPMKVRRKLNGQKLSGSQMKVERKLDEQKSDGSWMDESQMEIKQKKNRTAVAQQTMLRMP
jgi:hypothetical protein